MLRRLACSVSVVMLVCSACNKAKPRGNKGQASAASSAAASTTVRAAAPSTSAAPAASTDTAADAEDSASEGVTLLSAGAEPRSQLRLTWQLGQTALIEVFTQLRFEVQEQNGSAPQKNATAPLAVKLSVTVSDVTEAGDRKVALEVLSAKVRRVPGVTEAVAQRAETEFKAVEGMRGVATLSESGELKRWVLGAQSTGSAALIQTTDSLNKAFRRVFPELPQEAVGSGARWRVRRVRVDQGVAYTETAIYDLTEWSAPRGSLSVALSITGGEQYLSEHQMDVLSVVGSGTLRGTYDFNEIGPISADATMSVTSASRPRKRPRVIKMKSDQAIQLRRR